MKAARKLFYGKTLLITFLGSIVLTILSVYLTGFVAERSLFENSIISLTILAICLFFFLLYGLYNGMDVFDDYSHKLHIKWRKSAKNRERSCAPDLSGNMDFPDMGEGLGGIIVAIVLWILVSIVIVWLLVVLQSFLWMTLLIFLIAIYWLLIRALKLVFSQSKVCEGHWLKSVRIALLYTALYVSWVYAIVFTATLF